MAKIYHQSRKPILKFKTHHGTEIIADLDTGLKMLKEDFEERKRLLELEHMLNKEPKFTDEDFESLLEQYLPETREETIKMKYEGGK